ncbi:MAG: SDR family oxidoreductase [Planctomycetes bacterium]|nr:SDR family oxidoreductase [Planctomycetota bacterium]
MKVFVTGHRGFIGVHLVELLKQAGHQVTGCDLRLFEGCEWEPMPICDRELVKDVRELALEDVDGHDCVMHLAAISNDPMGDLDPDITFGINRDASIKLAQLAKQAGVGRYLFSGSCSVYGAGEKLDLAEDDTLNPLTAYAKSKIETETAVSELADAGFTPVYLRNATAYGHSPMLRIDLVVNNLLACALATGEIRIMSDGTPWRPLVHCRDIARAFIAFMNAPREKVSNMAINVGGNSENYRVRDVADQVKRLMPNASITFTGEVGADPRNYRVNFDLLGRVLPDFRLQYNLESGMDELHRKMVDHGFKLADFQGDRYVRLRTLRHRMNLLNQQAEQVS